MIASSAKPLRIALLVAFSAALTAAATPQACAQAGFAGYAGAWTGGGKISLANGSVERMRCTAEYQVEQSGAALSQSLSCASDTYSFELKNQIEAAGSEITGTWLEVTRNAQGSINGKASVGRIDGNVAGPGFTAAFSLREHANRQQIAIQVPGGQISEITAEFVRAH